jgi:NADPH-dependent 2,4-dienoyl-CoA reductase/sulfur reductase-like enzyme
VEVTDWVTGEQTLIPLAGPANRQGRIAADNIAGRPSRFRGTQGTAVVGMFGMTLASTGEDGCSGLEGGHAVEGEWHPRTAAIAAAMPGYLLLLPV